MSELGVASAPGRNPDWTAEQNDLIVAEYFAMLDLIHRGETFSKAQRKAKLDETLNRGIGSIDFKLGNVTAVAKKLALPPLPGFAAAPNFQSSIIEAVGRYLAIHPEVLADTAFLAPTMGSLSDKAPGLAEDPQAFDRSVEIIPLVLSEPPALGPPPKPRPDLERLVRKYDPATRDQRNRTLGELGERHVLAHEQAKLNAAGLSDLVSEIEWTSKVHGDGAGYDIRSFDTKGEELLIEVKATRGPRDTPFHLTRTEREVSMERPDAWRLYRVHEIASAPGLFVLPPPLERAVNLREEAWTAWF